MNITGTGRVLQVNINKLHCLRSGIGPIPDDSSPIYLAISDQYTEQFYFLMWELRWPEP